MSGVSSGHLRLRCFRFCVFLDGIMILLIVRYFSFYKPYVKMEHVMICFVSVMAKSIISIISRGYDTTIPYLQEKPHGW